MAGANDAALNIVLSTKDETGAGVASAEGKLAKLKGTVANLSATWAALGAATTAAMGFLSDAANAAAEDQASEARLTTAIHNSGASFDATAPAIRNRVKANQDLAFSDEQTYDSLSLLIVQTGSVDEGLRRQKLAMDLSRGANIDLYTASKLLGKVTDENAKVLARYGITVKSTGLTEAQFAKLELDVKNATDVHAKAVQHLKDVQALQDEKRRQHHKLTIADQIQLRDANAAVAASNSQLKDSQDALADATKKGSSEAALFAAVQQKFGGQAKTYADSTAGAIDRIKDRVNEWRKSVGGSLGPAQTLIALLPGMSTGFTLAGTLLSPLIEGIKLLGNTSLATAAKQRIAAAATAAWTVLMAPLTFAQDLNTFAQQRGYIGTLRYVAGLAAAKVATVAQTVATTAGTLASNLNTLAQQRGYLGALKYVAISAITRGATLAGVAAQWLLNAALTANPIGIVIVAIAALAAGFIWAYRNVGPFHDAVDKAWGVLKQFFSWVTGTAVPATMVFAHSVIGHIGGLFNWIGTTLHNLPTMVENAWHEFSSRPIYWIVFLAASALTLIGNLEVNLVKKAASMVGGFVAWFQQLPGLAVASLLDLEIKIGRWELRMVALAIKTGSGFIAGVGVELTKLPGQITGFLGAAWAALNTQAPSIVSRGVQMAKDFVAGIMTALVSLLVSVPHLIASAFGDAAGQAKQALHDAHVPGFAMGGVVMGARPGAVTMILAHGGETLVPAQRRGEGPQPDIKIPGAVGAPQLVLARVGDTVLTVGESRRRESALARGVEGFAMGGVVGGGAAFMPRDLADSPSAVSRGDVNVDVHIGTYVGDASKLSKILARELRLAGAF